MNYIFIDSNEKLNRVGIVENNRLVEFYSEEVENEALLGNVYRARVNNVLHGMDAAFVDIGVGKNAYLHLKDALSLDQLYTGIKYIEIQDSDNCIEDIINNIDLSELVENQYVLIGLWEYNKEFEQNQFKLEKGYRYSKGIFENIRNPRLGEKLNNCFKDNVEQRLVYDALNNDDIDILVVYGDAGVGKNYSVLANTFSLVKQPTKNKKKTATSI